MLESKLIHVLTKGHRVVIAIHAICDSFVRSKVFEAVYDDRILQSVAPFTNMV